jgi:hypothetical protein
VRCSMVPGNAAEAKTVERRCASDGRRRATYRRRGSGAGQSKPGDCPTLDQARKVTGSEGSGRSIQNSLDRPRPPIWSCPKSAGPVEPGDEGRGTASKDLALSWDVRETVAAEVDLRWRVDQELKVLVSGWRERGASDAVIEEVLKKQLDAIRAA